MSRLGHRQILIFPFPLKNINQKGHQKSHENGLIWICFETIWNHWQNKWWEIRGKWGENRSKIPGVQPPADWVAARTERWLSTDSPSHESHPMHLLCRKASKNFSKSRTQVTSHSLRIHFAMIRWSNFHWNNMTFQGTNRIRVAHWNLEPFFPHCQIGNTGQCWWLLWAICNAICNSAPS